MNGCFGIGSFEFISTFFVIGECAIFKRICTLIVGAVHSLSKQTMIHNVTMPMRILKVQTQYSGSPVAGSHRAGWSDSILCSSAPAVLCPHPVAGEGFGAGS